MQSRPSGIGFREADAKRPDALERVLLLAREGDRDATSTLLRSLAPHLMRTVRLVLGPRHSEIEDATQEAAYGVLTALWRYRGECTVLHFCCRIAVLTAMNVRRRETVRLHKAADLNVTMSDLASYQEGKTPEQHALAELCARAVRELLGVLPEAQAEALALHHVLGMTTDEIAAATDAPIETVRSRLKLGRRALRERVLEHPQLREALSKEA